MIVFNRFSKKPLLFLLGAISLWVSLVSENLFLSTVVFICYCLIIIYINSRGEMADPRTLLLGFFTVYSSWFSLQFLIIGNSSLPTSPELIKQSIVYQHLAAFVFVTILDLIIKEKTKKDSMQFICVCSKWKASHLSEAIIFTFCLFIAVSLLFLLYTSGVSTKRDLLDEQSSLNRFASFAFLAMTVIATLRATRIKDKLYLDIPLLFFVLLGLAFMLITGERDLIFRVIIIGFFVYFDKTRSASFILITAMLLSAVFVVPITQAFKAVFLSGEIQFSKSGLEIIFTNEFISASRNLYALLFYGVQHDLSFFFSDLKRAFLPSVFMSDINVISATNWFNNYYRVRHEFSGTSGWGFGLVAQGYLLSGGSGIVIIMIIYSSVIGFLYNIRHKSIYLYVFYFLALSSSIYVIRADMANFISQVFKVGGFFVFSIWLLHFLFKSAAKGMNSFRCAK